jgi:hypothetical protein
MTDIETPKKTRKRTPTTLALFVENEGGSYTLQQTFDSDTKGLRAAESAARDTFIETSRQCLVVRIIKRTEVATKPAVTLAPY